MTFYALRRTPALRLQTNIYISAFVRLKLTLCSWWPNSTELKVQGYGHQRSENFQTNSKSISLICKQSKGFSTHLQLFSWVVWFLMTSSSNVRKHHHNFCWQKINIFPIEYLSVPPQDCLILKTVHTFILCPSFLTQAQFGHDPLSNINIVDGQCFSISSTKPWISKQKTPELKTSMGTFFSL